MDVETFVILSIKPSKMYPPRKPAFIPYPNKIIGPQVNINFIHLKLKKNKIKLPCRVLEDYQELKVREEFVVSMDVMEKMVKKVIDVRVFIFQLKE